MKDYWEQKYQEMMKKHGHYRVGDRITYEVFGRRTGTIIKVVQPHFRQSDKRDIPFHYIVRGDTDLPGASPDVVFPKDILDE